MKNFILTLILLSPFSMLTGMEVDDIKEKSSVTIECKDGQLTIDTKTFENLEKMSTTFFQNLFTDCSPNKKIDISCTKITIEVLQGIISYLPKNPIYTDNVWGYSKSEKEELIKKLMNENIETLIPLLKDCNELGISILMNLLIEKVLPEKFTQDYELEQFIQNPHYIKQLKLPEDLSKAIASQIMNIIYNKFLSYTFPFHMFTYSDLPEKAIKKLNFYGKKNLITTLTFNYKNELLATGHETGNICIYRLSKTKYPELITQLTDHDYYTIYYYNNKPSRKYNDIKKLAFSNDNKWFASADKNNVHLYKITDIKNFKLTKLAKYNISCKKNNHYICSVYFSNNSQWFSFYGSNGHAYLYKLSDTKNPQLINKKFENVKNIAFSNDSNFFITGNCDGRICFYRLSKTKDPELTTQLTDHNNNVRTFALSDNNKWFASADEKNVYLYKVTDIKNFELTKLTEYNVDYANSVYFKKNSQFFGFYNHYDGDLYKLSDIKFPKLIHNARVNVNINITNSFDNEWLFTTYESIALSKLSNKGKKSVIIHIASFLQKSDWPMSINQVAFSNNKWFACVASDDNKSKSELFLCDLDIFNFLEKNILLEHALLIFKCRLQVSFAEHPHLYGYYKQLPKLTQKKLINKREYEAEPIKLSLTQKLDYYSKNISQLDYYSKNISQAVVGCIFVLAAEIIFVSSLMKM